MRKVVRWRRITPLVILVIAGTIGALQLLVLPVHNTTITAQAVTETIFLIIVIVGLFLIPTTRELTELEPTDAETIYPPILLGLGFFVIRGITDILDEFLTYPPGILAILEDGAMIIGILLLLLGIVRWIRTQQRQAQQLTEQQVELENQIERLDSFVRVVSHDLRNPLNVASGRLDIARAQHDTDNLEAVANAHDRMAALIDDLLQLTHHGETVGEYTPTSLADLADRCWQTVQTHDATLNIETNKIILADQSRLQQLIENLFRNAVEHGPAQVTITVGEIPGGFYVEDNGPGIPPDERDQVFSVGYSTNPDGTGFGLSIVKEIARAHDWNIQITDGTTGGARFEITGVDTPPTK